MTNAVESINRQSVLQNAKLVSLKPLIERFYLENKRQAILQLGSLENVTVSYKTSSRKRSHWLQNLQKTEHSYVQFHKARVQLVQEYL